MTENLTIALGETKKKVVNGKELEIQPIKLKTFQQVMTHAGKLMPYMKKPPEDGRQMFELITILLDKEYDSCVQLIALLSGTEKEWVEELAIDDALQVLSWIVEMNLDFFINRLLPALRVSAVGLIGGLTKGAAAKNPPAQEVLVSV